VLAIVGQSLRDPGEAVSYCRSPGTYAWSASGRTRNGPIGAAPPRAASVLVPLRRARLRRYRHEAATVAEPLSHHSVLRARSHASAKWRISTETIGLAAINLAAYEATHRQSSDLPAHVPLGVLERDRGPPLPPTEKARVSRPFLSGREDLNLRPPGPQPEQIACKAHETAVVLSNASNCVQGFLRRP
jgi:hypothetical protein